MSWLIGYTLASMAVAFIAVKIFDFIFAEASSRLVGIARGAVFVLVWTAITVKAGMRGFTSTAKRLKERTAGIRRRIGATTKGE